jgi:beta-galactosidase
MASGAAAAPTGPVLPPLTVNETSGVITIAGTTPAGAKLAVTFSRNSGTLTSLNFGDGELLAGGPDSGPRLQAWRAPTDNDRGFGKWLAREWTQAGLDHLSRTVESFSVAQPVPGRVQVEIVAVSSALKGKLRHRARWMVAGNGEVELESEFIPEGELPPLPRIGIVMQLASTLEQLQWYGRGPFENYADRKAAAYMGVWSGSVTSQYVPYVRPQENGNKEDVQWLTLVNTAGHGLRVEAIDAPLAMSALHFTAADLAAAKHAYELHPRADIVLSLDVRQCGLGNSSCGPGVLEEYAVPVQRYTQHLRFRRL